MGRHRSPNDVELIPNTCTNKDTRIRTGTEADIALRCAYGGPLAAWTGVQYDDLEYGSGDEGGRNISGYSKRGQGRHDQVGW